MLPRNWKAPSPLSWTLCHGRTLINYCKALPQETPPPTTTITIVIIYYLFFISTGKIQEVTSLHFNVAVVKNCRAVQSLRNRIFPSSVVQSNYSEIDAKQCRNNCVPTNTLLLYQWFFQPSGLQVTKTHERWKIQLPQSPVIVTKTDRMQVGTWRLWQTPSTNAITLCGIWKLEQENHMTWHGQMVGWRFQWNVAMFSHLWNFNKPRVWANDNDKWLSMSRPLKIMVIKYCLVTVGATNAGTWMLERV